MSSSQVDPDVPRLSTVGPVAHVVLSRPDRHNAIEARDVDQLLKHLDDVDADDGIRVLVLGGSGPSTFCSGASLRQMESGEMSGELFSVLTERLSAVRVPSLCALNGNAFGGGAEIALACDFRIGVAGCRIAVPAASLGICYPLPGILRFVSALGLQATRRLLLAGEELDTDQLHRLGFLDEVVAPADLAAATARRAERLAGMAPLAVRAMKRILRDLAGGVLDDDDALALIETCASSADLEEGLRARSERRPPRFEGR